GRRLRPSGGGECGDRLRLSRTSGGRPETCTTSPPTHARLEGVGDRIGAAPDASPRQVVRAAEARAASVAPSRRFAGATAAPSGSFYLERALADPGRLAARGTTAGPHGRHDRICRRRIRQLGPGNPR